MFYLKCRVPLQWWNSRFGRTRCRRLLWSVHLGSLLLHQVLLDVLPVDDLGDILFNLVILDVLLIDRRHLCLNRERWWQSVLNLPVFTDLFIIRIACKLNIAETTCLLLRVTGSLFLEELLAFRRLEEIMDQVLLEFQDRCLLGWAFFTILVHDTLRGFVGVKRPLFIKWKLWDSSRQHILACKSCLC